jgi:hypothetical protein
VFVSVFEPVLEGAEKALAAGDREDHAAEFAQETLPTFDGNAFPVTHFVK